MNSSEIPSLCQHLQEKVCGVQDLSALQISAYLFDVGERAAEYFTCIYNLHERNPDHLSAWLSRLIVAFPTCMVASIGLIQVSLRTLTFLPYSLLTGEEPSVKQIGIFGREVIRKACGYFTVIQCTFTALFDASVGDTGCSVIYRVWEGHLQWLGVSRKEAYNESEPSYLMNLSSMRVARYLFDMSEIVATRLTKRESTLALWVMRFTVGIPILMLALLGLIQACVKLILEIPYSLLTAEEISKDRLREWGVKTAQKVCESMALIECSFRQLIIPSIDKGSSLLDRIYQRNIELLNV